MSFEVAPIRIAQWLLLLHEKFGGIIPETRTTLAELAGTSVETAIRVTKELSRRHILRTKRGQIEICSLSALRACASGNSPKYDGYHKRLNGYLAESQIG